MRYEIMQVMLLHVGTMRATTVSMIKKQIRNLSSLKSLDHEMGIDDLVRGVKKLPVR